MTTDASAQQPALKFGTFLGVFTPSVLTILGLIMYLRFGWVVGNLGLPVTLLHYLLLILLAVTIVISIKVVGIILVSAFLVIPGATGKLLTSNFRRMLLISAGVGTASSLIGLYASYQLEIPSGATIVLVQFLFLLAAIAARRFAVRSS